MLEGGPGQPYRGSGEIRGDRQSVGASSELLQRSGSSKAVQHHLEEILATMGENGERKIEWNFHQTPYTPQALVEKELGTGETPKVAWELRIRELEEEGWTTCYTDGSGLEIKAEGAYTQKCHLGFHEDKPDSEYLVTRATHYDGELSCIAQGLEELYCIVFATRTEPYEL